MRYRGGLPQLLDAIDKVVAFLLALVRERDGVAKDHGVAVGARGEHRLTTHRRSRLDGVELRLELDEV